MRKHKASLSKPIVAEEPKPKSAPVQALVIKPAPESKEAREWTEDDFDNPLFACFKDILHDNDILLDHPMVDFLKFIYMNGAFDGLEILKTGVPLDPLDPTSAHSSYSMYDLISEAADHLECEESQEDLVTMTVLSDPSERPH
jgi:hypothetical protein